jgi:hypothetical protein
MHTVPRSEERPVVDAQHLNSVIQAVTWVLLAITTLALIFRLLTRFYLREKRDFGWEDALIILSYVCKHQIKNQGEQSCLLGRNSHSDLANL